LIEESNKKQIEKEKQIEFIENRRKKSRAIALILFIMVFTFFLTTVIRISSNIS
tara:strand:- start:1454 stop:1615 length:162 start_codon:yes stop_codon:yes gene_type:complete